MSDIREDMDIRLLALIRNMAPEKAEEVLAFAERIAAQSKDRERALEAVNSAFGIWRDRQDMQGDSVELVRSIRQGWEEREEHLGLA